ncbi:MAG: hypothetical protein PHY08_09840, partial [Candidatus Cloacimonetes bacterium]|nr:hypothetical protein [Candidatus Cloacimonadota bacterium]
ETKGLNDIERVLNKIGIRVRESVTELRDFDDVLADISEKYPTMDEVSRNAVSTALGGARQREFVNILLEDYSGAKELAKISEESAGTAEEKYKAYAESLEAATKRLQASWEQLTLKMSTSDFIKFFTNTLAKAVEYLPYIAKYIGVIITTLNAYKMPIWLKGLFGNPANFGAGLKAFGKGAIGSNYADKKQAYIDKRNISDPTSNLNNTITNQLLPKENQLIGSIDRNTAALNGESIQGTTGKPLVDGNGKPLVDQKGKPTQQQTTEAPQKRTYVQNVKSRLGAGALTGAVSGLMSGFAVQGDTEDKVIAGALSGGLSAIGTAFAGPLGGMFGNFIGDGVSSLIRDAKYREERERTERIAQAEKMLGTLNNLNDSFKGLEKLSKQNWNSEDFEEATKYFDNILDVLRQDENELLTVNLLDKINENIISVDENSNKTYTSVSQLRNDYLGESGDRQLISQALKKTLIQEQKEQYIDSQEQLFVDMTNVLEETGNFVTNSFMNLNSNELKEINEKFSFIKENIIRTGGDLGGSYKTISVTKGIKGNTLEERLSEIEKLLADTSLENYLVNEDYTTLKDYQKQLKTQIANQQDFYDKIHTMDTQQAYEATDISQMSQTELKQMGKEGVIKEIAKTLELEGYSSRYNEKFDSEGNLLSFDLTTIAREQIEKYIKTIPELRKLLAGEGLTLNEILGLEEGERQTQELQNFATALGKTVGQVVALKDKLGNATLADLLLGPAEVRDKLKGYVELYQNLLGNGLSAENLENILKNYSNLVPYLGNPAELTEQVGSTMDMYSNDLYKRAIFEELSDSEEFLTKFLEGASPETQALFKKNKIEKFNEGWGLINSDDNLKTEVQDYYDKVQISYNPERAKAEAQIKAQNFLIDRQLKNLNEQKEALTNINKQREYELKLLQARNKLEEAKKEKKKIFRSGIGWVYESDQGKIQEAQKELDTLEKEKDIDLIQLQIEQLEATKEFFSDLKNEEFLKNLEQTYGDFNSNQLKVMQEIKTAYEKIAEFMPKKYINEKLTDEEKVLAEAKLNLYGGKDKEGNSVVGSYNEYIKAKGDYDKIKYPNAEEVGNYNQVIEKFLADYNSVLTKKGEITEEVKKAAESASTKPTPMNSYTILDEDGRLQNFVPSFTSPMDSTNNTYQQIVGDAKTGGVAYWSEMRPGETRSFDNKTGIVKDPNFNLTEWASKQKDNTIVSGYAWDDEYAFIKNGRIYDLGQIKRKAEGDYSLNKSGIYNINEPEFGGTEGIITPQGTLTALPSKTGIVPADLTRNLFILGEVAPNLIQQLSSLNRQSIYKQKYINDESMNIDNLIVHLQANKGLDAEAFLKSIKAQINITKHNKNR